MVIACLSSCVLKGQNIHVDLSGKYDFGVNNFTTDFILASNGSLITKVDFVQDKDQKKFNLQKYDSKYLIMDEKELEHTAAGSIHEIIRLNNKILVSTYSGCVKGSHDFNVLKLNSDMEIEKPYNAIKFQDVYPKEAVKMNTIVNEDESMLCFTANQKNNKSIKIKAVVNDYNFNKLWVNEYEIERNSGKYEVDIRYHLQKNGELLIHVKEYNNIENIHTIYKSKGEANLTAFKIYKDVECLSVKEVNGKTCIAGIVKKNNKYNIFIQMNGESATIDLPELIYKDIQVSLSKSKFPDNNYIKVKNINVIANKPIVTFELNAINQLANEKEYYNQYVLGNLYQVELTEDISKINDYEIIYRNQKALSDLVTGTVMLQNEVGKFYIFNDHLQGASNSNNSQISNTDDCTPYLLAITNDKKIIKKPLLEKEYKDYDLVPKSCRVIGNKIYFVVVKTNLKGIKDQRIGVVSIT